MTASPSCPETPASKKSGLKQNAAGQPFLLRAPALIPSMLLAALLVGWLAYQGLGPFFTGHNGPSRPAEHSIQASGQEANPLAQAAPGMPVSAEAKEAAASEEPIAMLPEAQNVPVEAQERPIEAQNAPTGEQEAPVATQNLPVGEQNVPAEAQNVPAGEQEAPSSEGTLQPGTNATLAAAAPLSAEDLPENMDPAWIPLVERLEKEGFAREDLLELFAKMGKKSYTSAFMAAKITELYGVGGIGIKQGADAPQLPEGYEQPLSDITVGEYKAFKDKYAAELKAILDTHGVPANVVVALLLVETGLGSDLGKTTAFRSLAAMAATDTVELLGSSGNSRQTTQVNAARLKATLKDKSDWAFNELTALIRYGQDTSKDVTTIPGSMYGAIGICQFMPSNIELFGVDGDGDGTVNLFSVVDAMYSAANYLEAHGWRGAKSDEQKFDVLRSYNQDNIYATRVLSISKQLALADQGKLADNRNPMYGPGTMPVRSLDPSLRRLRRPPASARVHSLGSYEDLLKP